MYALNLDSNRRILSATYEEFASPDMPVVSDLPDGDITDYIFISMEEPYIYDPLPKPSESIQEPSANDILNVLLGVKE